ncbi:MAG: HAD-IIA family hydrolase [Limnochordaceae bacterium]|nr:HAD-IIA family hydrolase [Limnochordaceae bacterium]
MVKETQKETQFTSWQNPSGSAKSPQPQAFILDLDGVVYRGNQVIPGAPAFFERAAAHGCCWIFVSNNSTRTPEAFAEKLTRMGIPTRAEQVVTSGQVTAEFVRDELRRELEQPPRLFVIGEEGLRTLLLAAGAELVETPESWQELPPPVDAVVVGLDTAFTFAKLRAACHWIRQGARFIGTNPDRTFPYPSGIGPGAGTILAAVQACTDVEPLVMGKPSPPILRAALRRLGVAGPAAAAEVCLVGDRLDTDIAGAHSVGLSSCLVLTGVTSAAQVADPGQLPAAWRPSRVVESLAVLADQLWGNE